MSSQISELCRVLRLFLSPSLVFLSIAGGIRNGAGLVFAYNVDSFFTQYRDTNSAHYMSWVPLVGGTIGSLLGGILSDRAANLYGHTGRMMVLVVSQVGTCLCRWFGTTSGECHDKYGRQHAPLLCLFTLEHYSLYLMLQLLYLLSATSGGTVYIL